MDIFLKGTGCVLIGVILCLALSGYAKDLSILLVMAVCCVVVASAVMQISPVIAFFERLQSVGNLNQDYLRILLKTVGVGMLAETAALICEAGQAIGYGNAVFITIGDTTSPIIFTITETAITCDTGYGVYQGGFYSAFYPFTLNLAGSTRAPQKAPMARGLATPKQLPVQKIAPMSRVLKGKTEGEAPHQQLKTMTTREITE